MDVFDDEAETSPSEIDDEELESDVPARPIRAARPLMLERGRVPDDEERTRFLDRGKPVPPAPPSRPSAPPRSVRPKAPRVALEEPTVFKPMAARPAPLAPLAPRRSAPPPAHSEDPRAVMSWPAPSPLARPISTSPVPIPPVSAPAPRSSRAPETHAGARARGDSAQGRVLFASPARMSGEPSVIVPRDAVSTGAIVRDRLASDSSVDPLSRAHKGHRKPGSYVVAGGVGLLGTLVAFAAVVGVTSMVRSSSAATEGKIALHPPIIMAAASPVGPATAAEVVASDPLPAAPAGWRAQAAAPVPGAGSPGVSTVAVAAPVAAMVTPLPVALAPAAPIAATAPPAAEPHIAPSRPVPHVMHAPHAQPPAVAVAAAPADAPKAHKGKASKSDIDDAKAADDLARAQLEASLR